MSTVEYSEEDEEFDAFPISNDTTEERSYIVYAITENDEEETVKHVAFSTISELIKEHIDERVSKLLDNITQLVKNRSFTETITVTRTNHLYLCVFCFLVNSNARYLVCLVISHTPEIDNSMQLMLPDINNYVVDIVAPLLFESENDIEVSPAEKLEQWYSGSIDYIGGSITALGAILPNFLHASLVGRSVNVPSNPTMEANLRRVAGMIQLIQDDMERSVTISLRNDDDPSADYNHSNLFCEEWAQSLRETAQDPISCRQKIDQFRLIVVKRLNDLRRMLDCARLHNHDLYRSYVMIGKSNNEDILLTILSHDVKNNQSLAEVIGVIIDYSKAPLNL